MPRAAKGSGILFYFGKQITNSKHIVFYDGIFVLINYFDKMHFAILGI